MDNNNELELYALFLENWGKTGLAPNGYTPEQIVSMKDWEFPFPNKYSIGNKIRKAYRDRNNKELIRLLHILMGYHYLEKFKHENNGYQYGSPTFIQAYNVPFDTLIWRFLKDFIRYNGGNYYQKPEIPVLQSDKELYKNIYDSPYYYSDYKNYYRDLNIIKKIEKEKSHKELYQIIKNRDLYNLEKKSNSEILTEWEINSNRNIKNEINKYENWRKEQEWFPEHSKLIDTEKEISQNKIFKNEIIEKINKLQKDLAENQEDLEKLIKIYNKSIKDYKRKRNLRLLESRPSEEILDFLIYADEPLDLYETLSSNIKIKDIQKLSKDMFRVFTDKVSKTNKKSEYRKILKHVNSLE